MPEQNQPLDNAEVLRLRTQLNTALRMQADFTSEHSLILGENRVIQIQPKDASSTVIYLCRFDSVDGGALFDRYVSRCSSTAVLDKVDGSLRYESPKELDSEQIIEEVSLLTGFIRALKSADS